MKKLIAIITLLVLSATFAFAQFKPMFPTTSGNQKIVETALKNAVCIMRIEYQLEDTVSHEKYNVEGKDYFGFSEGLCVKTSEGWVAPSFMTTPLESDSKAGKYPEYRPVISSASVLAVQDSVWKEISVPSVTGINSIPSTSFSAFKDSVTFSDGLKISKIGDSAEGWIVWVCQSGDQITLKSYSHFLASSDSTSYGIGYKVVPDNAIGGFFVTAAGHFRICGTVGACLITAQLRSASASSIPKGVYFLK